MKSLSGKELEIISHLEFNRKYYFVREDIKKFFKNENLMNYYLYRLKTKGRIFKLNKEKYFLVPIKAKGGFWAEHPLVIVDEIMNSKNYYIGGAYAKYYWKYMEQIPREINVYSTRKQGSMRIFNIKINFKRVRKINSQDYVIRKIYGHIFNIATKKYTKKWIK